MTRGHRAWLAGGVAAAVIAVAIVIARHRSANPGASSWRVPPFDAWTIDSLPTRRSLDDYAGQAILLNVWATWCDPCREEMPSIERLYQAYRDRGLRVVAVSIDDAGSAPLIREFVQEHHLTFDILHDPKSSIMRLYGVLGVPQTFLISRGGEIFRSRFVADWSSAESRALIDSLLRAGSP